MASLRSTCRPASMTALSAVLVAGALATGSALAQPISAPLGAFAVVLIGLRRAALVRWSLLLLVGQLAVVLAGDRDTQPVALLAGPWLVACAELAFAAAELRMVPAEEPSLLAQRLRFGAEAMLVAAVTAGAAALLAEAPFAHGAGLTIAGLLAAGAAVTVIAADRRR